MAAALVPFNAARRSFSLVARALRTESNAYLQMLYYCNGRKRSVRKCLNMTSFSVIYYTAE
jgi:hypothetical protein